ncbi:MAG: DUF1707 domain-containing protein [Propioniciclava sp.]
MPELPRSSPYVSTPEAPLGEEERSGLVERLNAAYTDGTIPAHDYEQYLDLLFAATTLGEVAAVVAQLPVRPTHDTPAIVGVGEGRPGELAPLRSAVQPRVLLAAAAGVGLLIVILVVLLVL